MSDASIGVGEDMLSLRGPVQGTSVVQAIPDIEIPPVEVTEPHPAAVSREDFEHLAEIVRSLLASVNSLGSTDASLSHSVMVNSSRLQDQIDSQRDELKKLENSLLNLHGFVSELGSNLSVLGRTVAENRDQLRAELKAQDDAVTRMLEQAIAENKDRFAAELTDHNLAFENHQAQINNLFASIAKQIGDLNFQMNGAMRSIKSLGSTDSLLAQTITESRDRLRAECEATFADIKSQIDNQCDRIVILEHPLIPEIEIDTKPAEEAEAIAKQIGDLTFQMNGAMRIIKAMSARLANLETKVEKIEFAIQPKPSVWRRILEALGWRI